MKELLKEIRDALELWNGETLYYDIRCGEPWIADCDNDAVHFNYDDLIQRIDEKLRDLDDI